MTKDPRVEPDDDTPTPIPSSRRLFEALLAYRVGLIAGEIDSLEERLSRCTKKELSPARMTAVLTQLERAKSALAAVFSYADETLPDTLS